MCAAAVKRRFVDGAFGQLNLRISRPEASRKRPLVCLHMFPQSGRNFQAFLEEAGEDRIFVAPDMPGYGEFDAPPRRISAQDYAAALWQVGDALSLTEQFGTIDLFGIHAGAKLVVEAACQRFDDVNEIVLSSAAVLTEEEVSEFRQAFAPIPLNDTGTRFSELWLLQVRNRGQKMSYDDIATAFAEVVRRSEGIEWGHQAVFDYNREFPRQIASLPHRITLLNPEDDLHRMTPRTEPYLNNGQLINLPGWHSGLLTTRAAEFAKLLLEILDKNPAPKTEYAQG